MHQRQSQFLRLLHSHVPPYQCLYLYLYLYELSAFYKGYLLVYLLRDIHCNQCAKPKPLIIFNVVLLNVQFLDQRLLSTTVLLDQIGLLSALLHLSLSLGLQTLVCGLDFAC